MFGNVGTRDATNSYKAYRRDFVQTVGIDSDAGFELGIELVAKARRLRLPVAELPTIWLDRAHGQSNFRSPRGSLAISSGTCSRSVRSSRRSN